MACDACSLNKLNLSLNDGTYESPIGEIFQWKKLTQKILLYLTVFKLVFIILNSNEMF